MAYDDAKLEVEIEANVEYSVKIDEAVQWLRLAETRAMNKSTLSFELDSNFELEERSTVVELLDGEAYVRLGGIALLLLFPLIVGILISARLCFPTRGGLSIKTKKLNHGGWNNRWFGIVAKTKF